MATERYQDAHAHCTLEIAPHRWLSVANRKRLPRSLSAKLRLFTSQARVQFSLHSREVYTHARVQKERKLAHYHKKVVAAKKTTRQYGSGIFIAATNYSKQQQTKSLELLYR